MDQDLLPKAYDPANIELHWYSFWEQNKLFHADDHRTGKEYSIVIPPPNVTGSLHMGHALNNTLQDILIRYNRMNQVQHALDAGHRPCRYSHSECR